MYAMIIDTETTSPDPETCAPLELAFALIDLPSGGLLSCGSWLADYAADPKAIEGEELGTEIHGITRGMLANEVNRTEGCGSPMQHHIEWLNETCNPEYGQNPAFVIAHNAQFDRAVLERFGLRTDLPWVCTYEQMRWPGFMMPMRQIDLALKLGIGVLSAHRAIDDALTLQRCLARASEASGRTVADLLTAAHAEEIGEFSALVSFDDKDKAKSAGFRWEPDTKRWIRRMRVSDVAALAFPTTRLK